jgi:hypothetical protein
MAGLDRARSSGKRLGRPRTTPFQIGRIRAALDEGRGVRETARLLNVSAAKVSEVRRTSATTAGLRTQSPRRAWPLLCHENTYKQVIPSHMTAASRG